MNPELQFHPAFRELRQAVAELSLISHAPTQSYQLAPPEDRAATPDRWRKSDRLAPVAHLGSHRPKDGDTQAPRGSDVDRPPRDAEHDERIAWAESYQRKTPDYFRDQLEKCHTEARLIALRDECRAVLLAWKRQPMPAGQEPASRADPNWKRWVAESKLDIGEIARRFDCSRRHVYKIRQDYREAA